MRDVRKIVSFTIVRDSTQALFELQLTLFGIHECFTGTSA